VRGTRRWSISIACGTADRVAFDGEEHAMTEHLDSKVGTPAPENGGSSWLRALLGQRIVQATILAWVIANVVVLVVAQGHLPFHRPDLHDPPFGSQVLAPNLAIVEVLVLIGLTFALTRRRTIPDVGARAPERTVAARETFWLIIYGIGGLIGGLLLALILGYHPISFHLAGTLYGTDDVVTPTEVAVWAAYNFAVFAVGPYLYFRRRYTPTQLNLKSTNIRNDVLVIVVVLAVESAAELVGLSSAIFGLTAREALIGMPLTFVVYFVGTVLPTMIFIQCVLVPRFRRLTGSTAATVILGGITYALLHCFDGWLAFDTVDATILSIIFLFFQYFGPRHGEDRADPSYGQRLGPRVGLPRGRPACPGRYAERRSRSSISESRLGRRDLA
jgi:hypothetical protein